MKVHIHNYILQYNWDQAFQKCMEKNSSLVSIETAAEMTTLSEVIKSYEYGVRREEHDFWTSGNDRAEESHFYWWGIGKPIQYAAWFPGEPDNYRNVQHCVRLLYKVGIDKVALDDIECHGGHNYICQK